LACAADSPLRTVCGSRVQVLDAAGRHRDPREINTLVSRPPGAVALQRQPVRALSPDTSHK